MQGTLTAPPSTAAVPRAPGRRMLYVALVLGAVTALLIAMFLNSAQSRADTGIPMISVVVARENIAAGKKVTAAMVEVKALPETAIVSDSYTSRDDVVERTVRYPVAKGEQISATRLVDPPKTPTLSFQIPAGLRGFTIPVTVTKSPAALLAPGDFVDVVGSFEMKNLWILPPAGYAVPQEVEKAHIPITLIQNVQVMSVQRQFVENGVPYDPSVRGTPPKEANITYVTLAITPEDVQLLTMAVDRAKLLTVSMRRFGDEETKELAPGWQWAPANPSNDPNPTSPNRPVPSA